MANINIPNQGKPKRVGFQLSIFGALLSVAGIAFTFSPIALAFLATPPGGNAFSEGGSGGGAAIWLMIFTLPIGAAAAITGMVFLISGILYTLKTKTPSESEYPELRAKAIREKSISFALLVPIIMISQPVIAFVLGNMIIGPVAALITIWATAGLAMIAIAAAIFFALTSKVKWLQIGMVVLGIALLAGIYLEANTLYQLFTDFNKL